MKKSSNNTILYGGLAVLAVVGLSSFGKKPKQEDLPETTQPDNGGIKTSSTATPTILPPKFTTPTKPNYNLLLKIGRRGVEVAALQKLLTITADGVFGPQTESALFFRKGVKQITLTSFMSTPDQNSNPYGIR